ncbi:hypothetical protein [Palleronia sp.]|uniref:hypothetical protein n=1 Tax=Palleronia sp. TaxID=1940284 RepID=UPI0035C7C43F
MRRDLGEDILPELLALFVSEAADMIPRISAVDPAGSVPLFQTLKASAQTIGMSCLTLACKRAETAARNGQDIDANAISVLVERSAEAFGAECTDQIRNSARIGSPVMSR